jgi:hypothetical protein
MASLRLSPDHPIGNDDERVSLLFERSLSEAS